MRESLALRALFGAPAYFVSLTALLLLVYVEEPKQEEREHRREERGT